LSSVLESRRPEDESTAESWPIPVPAHDRYDPEGRLWPLLRAVFGSYRWLFAGKIHVIGKENNPAGARILVSNHARVSDPFILPSVLGSYRGLTQIESFTIPFFGWLLARAGQIPITPGRGRQAMDRALEQLTRGRTILIYPEGRLSHGGEMIRAKTGMARLAFQSGAPILPVAVHVPPRYCRTVVGQMYGRPTVGVWQVGGPIWFAIGEPWRPFAGQTAVSAADLRRVTDEAMSRVRRLLDQAHTADG
jgi:1-acyl-sn-glycerol-3-phosphate acyltransferase